MKIIQWIISLFKKPTQIIPPTTGGTINYAPSITNTAQNWWAYFSLPYRTQVASGGKFDEDNCETRSAIEIIEALLNYYLKNNLFVAPLQAFFTNQKNGWLNSQGFIKLSIRYNAKENNTTAQGISSELCWNNFAIYGIVPESMYPDPPVPFTWDEYYAPVPDDICMLGEYVAKILIQIQWQVIINGNWGVANVPLLQMNLASSPLQIAGKCGNVDSNGVETWNGKKVYQHARVIGSIDTYFEVLDSYEYPNNYNRKLTLSFPMPSVIGVNLKIV